MVGSFSSPVDLTPYSLDRDSPPRIVGAVMPVDQDARVYFTLVPPTPPPREWRHSSLSAILEAPTGKPVTTIAHNTSATSVYISWKPPPPETILGEFLGYRITYRTRDKSPEDDAKEIYIRDSTVESHEIHNLETYTQYLVSIQVFNPEGLGPPTTVLVMTDEGDYIKS
ncbi:netrin receptor unc-40-like [Topomyia yanbarensis]|uniref:netrin receptor unc-40-like n=1 Tax=Topomyia yanbarensis TaxID=2498891 RepID=UPI00273BF537|nr:netrin receptor unc-40-like [Topomyia yanbarensis]